MQMEWQARACLSFFATCAECRVKSWNQSGELPALGGSIRADGLRYPGVKHVLTWDVLTLSLVSIISLS